MPALSDQLLAGGCASAIDALHGEPVTVLDGDDAGKTFRCVIENETDAILATDLGEDPRPKRIARFTVGQSPRLKSQNRLRTEDGKVWKATRMPGVAFLTVDFELLEVTELDT